MNFWNYYLEGWYWFYLLMVPALLLFTKTKRPAILLTAVCLLPLLISVLDYARQQAIENYGGNRFDCWVFDVYFFCLFSLISMIYVGWWELGIRAARRQLSWSIKENLRHGIISGVIVFLSLILPFYWFLIGYFIVSYRDYLYFKFIPLFC